jgi:hypothetical protein
MSKFTFVGYANPHIAWSSAAGAEKSGNSHGGNHSVIPYCQCSAHFIRQHGEGVPLIITQTPLRISFFGGGTDFREFFLKEGGCVLSSAVDRYIFVIIKQRFDDKIRIGYTKTEMVDNIDEIEHELVRESLRKTGISKRVEIATMGDIPSSGSGMGSSSTVTVGLLNAMYEHLGRSKDCDTLAREACEIELDAFYDFGCLRAIIYLTSCRFLLLRVHRSILQNCKFQ